MNTYTAFVDYGQIGTPGVIVQEFTHDTQDGYALVIYTGADPLYLDDDRFGADDPQEPSHDDMDRWETVLAEHGWVLDSEWRYGGNQYSTFVTPAAGHLVAA